MTDQAERYDRIAAGYARWWAPVLAPAVRELLDDFEPRAAGVDALVDIGTGTGQLALGAIERWSGVSIVGIDASAGMCAIADSEAERRLSAAERVRFRSVVADAERLPFDDATFDAALSSFVLQLVPRRARALREARRVLRPGGTLAYVSWLEDARVFLPDAAFDEVLEDLGFEARSDGGRSGDLPSIERAAGELRAAGFTGAIARGSWLEHRFTIEGYTAFLTEFDEESFFAELEPDERKEVLTKLADHLERLTPAQMTMRFPIVFASGRRSG